MPDYVCFGKFDQEKYGHPESYFRERYTFLDGRGGLKIAKTAELGFGNKIITQSHNLVDGAYTGAAVDRPVTIDDYAWVTSFCVLYNCHIEHHAIVGCGAVVKNCVVPPYTIVEGNPARIVAHWTGNEWEMFA